MNKRDLFKAFLVENANFDGKFELPRLWTSDEIPEKRLNGGRIWR